MFPVKWNVAGLGKIIAGARRDYAQPRRIVGAHNAVDGLMNATVTACNQDSIGAAIHLATNLVLEVTDRPTLVQFEFDISLLEQRGNMRHASPGAPSPGRRVYKKRYWA